MEFDTKAEIVSECWMIVRKQEAWAQLLEFGDLGFPLAYAYTNKLISLEEKGAAFVDEVYTVMLASLDIPDEDYADFEAVLDKHIELHPENVVDSPEGNAEDQV